MAQSSASIRPSRQDLRALATVPGVVEAEATVLIHSSEHSQEETRPMRRVLPSCPPGLLSGQPTPANCADCPKGIDTTTYTFLELTGPVAPRSEQGVREKPRLHWMTPPSWLSVPMSLAKFLPPLSASWCSPLCQGGEGVSSGMARTAKKIRT